MRDHDLDARGEAASRATDCRRGARSCAGANWWRRPRRRHNRMGDLPPWRWRRRIRR